MLGLHFNTSRLASDNSSNKRQTESPPTDDWVKEMRHIHSRKHESALLKRKDLEPDLVAQACNPNYFRGLGRKITNSRL